MAARHFNLVLAGVAKRLSDVYGDGPGVIEAAHDIPYKVMTLQAETGAIQVGGDPTVSATVYGNSIAIGASLALNFPGGPTKLSEFWAFGTGTLHILAHPY